MRITISTSDRTVHLTTGKHEKVSLRAAERTAVRLFHALPGPRPEPEKNPVGFSLGTDIERADDPAPEPHDDEE